jgi:hypothetical protein
MEKEHHTAVFNKDELYKLMFARKFDAEILAEQMKIKAQKVQDWLDGKKIPSKEEQELIMDILG